MVSQKRFPTPTDHPGTPKPALRTGTGTPKPQRYRKAAGFASDASKTKPNPREGDKSQAASPTGRAGKSQKRAAGPQHSRDAFQKAPSIANSVQRRKLSRFQLKPDFFLLTLCT